MAETKRDASLEDQHTAAVTPMEPSLVRTRTAARCADASEPTKSAEAGAPLQHSTAHDDTDIDIIWHNLCADSDFSILRKKSEGPVERILVDFARVLEKGIFEEVVSVSASKYLFTVTVACSKGWDEIAEHVMSVQ